MIDRILPQTRCSTPKVGGSLLLRNSGTSPTLINYTRLTDEYRSLSAEFIKERRKCEISLKAMHVQHQSEAKRAFFSSLSLFNYFLFNILSQEEGKKPFLEFIMHGLIFSPLSRNEIFEFYGSQRRLETKFFLFALRKS